MDRSEVVNGFTRVRVPIRMKITLPYLLLAVVLALGAAYVITQVVFDTISERFNNQLAESGKLASEWMVKDENRMLEILRLVSHTQGLPEAIERGDTQTARDLALGIAVNNRVEAVEFLDLTGNWMLSIRHRPSGSAEDYDFTQAGGPAFLQYPFVQKVVNGEQDEQGDKFAGLVQSNSIEYLYVAGPILKSDGTPAGSVLIGQSLSSLARAMREEILAQVTLYNFDGKPVYSTFDAPQAINSADVTSILDFQDQSSLKRDLPLNQTGSIDPMDYAEIIAPWEVRDGTDIGLMGISLAKTFLVSTSRVTRLQISILVALTLLLVIILGVNVANFVTRPLMGLVSASKEVANGNLDIQVNSNSGDEVALLADTFNQMITSLNQSKQDLLNAYDSTLEGWALALELRDDETKGHSQRVTEATLRLARAMGFDENELMDIRRGALLHDIGKMGIPDAILLKPGALDVQEMEIMRQHVRYGYDMLTWIDYLLPALDIPYCHHERWDGQGYPRGLMGEEIPLAARIFSVVDVWDAMLSQRPYHAPFPREVVLQYIQDGSGTQFDPNVVEEFMKLYGPAVDRE